MCRRVRKRKSWVLDKLNLLLDIELLFADIKPNTTCNYGVNVSNAGQTWNNCTRIERLELFLPKAQFHPQSYVHAVT